jgi:uncharacterized membrane protein
MQYKLILTISQYYFKSDDAKMLAPYFAYGGRQQEVQVENTVSKRSKLTVIISSFLFVCGIATIISTFLRWLVYRGTPIDQRQLEFPANGS